MIYVLDTDILVLFQEGQPAVCQRVLEHRIDELATTVITVEEQLSGWYTLLRRAKGPQPLARAYQRLADSVRLLSRFQILSFTEPTIGKFEQLKTPQAWRQTHGPAYRGDYARARRDVGHKLRACGMLTF